MPVIECSQASKEARILRRALQKKGLEPILEFFDEHKHVDMCIKKARLYVEVDGRQHKTNYNQINSDIKRDYWSRKQNYKTLRFTNKQINNELDKVVNKIMEEVNNRIK
ncbi:DUF559 domain-containing protein [Candidatus Parcubacteria bacterium]|nr:DUF559 domain-containing protein [Candidatus Parcubacteria bacterium]